MLARHLSISIMILGLLACPRSTPETAPPPDTATPDTPAPEPGEPVEEPPVEEQPVEEPPPVEPTPPRIDPAKIYDLVVSFTSPGNGTDGEAFERLKTAIAGFTGVVHDTGRWGKEGEHDECFDLTALSKKDRAAFVKKAKAAVAKSERTQVREASTCNDDGR